MPMLLRHALLLLLSVTLAACRETSDTPGSSAENMLNAGSTLPVCPAASNPLHDIAEVQGEASLSPMLGREVTVRGVVVGDFQETSQLKGFFIQQAVPDGNRSTSDGIFVYDPAQTVAVAFGDYVQVSGRVEEFKSGKTDPERLTQISRLTDASVCGSGFDIKPVELVLPVKDKAELEALEGMRVHITQPLYVSETYRLGRYGELLLSPESRLYHPNNHPSSANAGKQTELNARSRILLDDGMTIANPYPTPYLSGAGSDGTRRVGDMAKGLQGVLTWSFDAYRIQPTQAPEFTSANPRPALPAPVGGTLRTASLNVLNYFTSLDERGANSPEEFRRQKDKLIATIIGLNADVLGLMEIENNGAVALKDLIEAVNMQAGANTYRAIDGGTIGSDEIKVAIIYKPAAVSPAGKAETPAVPAFDAGGGMRPPLAQRFVARSNNGVFWFVVSHLKSKGSCPYDSDSANRDMGQGCWNATRVTQASALKDWVAELTASSGENDVLMVGDFNAYLNEDPVLAIEAGKFENLIRRLPPADRYTYVFNGESGALDYAFASESLRSQVSGVTVWHINADEPPVFDYNTEFKTDDRYAATPFRSSDHDPVLVGLSLKADTGK